MERRCRRGRRPQAPRSAVRSARLDAGRRQRERIRAPAPTRRGGCGADYSPPTNACAHRRPQTCGMRWQTSAARAGDPARLPRQKRATDPARTLGHHPERHVLRRALATFYASAAASASDGSRHPHRALQRPLRGLQPAREPRRPQRLRLPHALQDDGGALSILTGSLQAALAARIDANMVDALAATASTNGGATDLADLDKFHAALAAIRNLGATRRPSWCPRMPCFGWRPSRKAAQASAD